jgi:hypothetical protein
MNYRRLSVYHLAMAYHVPHEIIAIAIPLSTTSFPGFYHVIIDLKNNIGNVHGNLSA